MKLLVIVNYQNDYVDGSLGFPRAKEIEDEIISSLSNYDDYIFLLDEIKENYNNSLDYKILPVEHALKGSFGAKVYGKLNDYLNSAKKIIYKESFGSLGLIDFLRDNNKYDEIDLCGISSHQSVLANAIIARTICPNSLITVRKNLSQSFDKSLEAKAYNILNSLYIEVR